MQNNFFLLKQLLNIFMWDTKSFVNKTDTGWIILSDIGSLSESIIYTADCMSGFNIFYSFLKKANGFIIGSSVPFPCPPHPPLNHLQH
jgi:hypothetical protein